MKNGFFDVLGVRIAALDYRRAIRSLEEFIRDGRTHYVTLTNVHAVTESRYDAALRTALDSADLVLPDGMPIAWAGNIAGHDLKDRVCGPDLMLKFINSTAHRGYRHFFFGGAEGVAEELAARLKKICPEMVVAGAYSPPFRPLTESEEAELAHRVNGKVDVLWVGLGCPKQEKWMLAHQHLRVGVMLGVGAAFDFHTERIARAPRWMQRCGLEWAFRLAQDPKRLWRRYLVYNSLFLFFYLSQQVRLRRFDAAAR
ncbi:MAG TPA: WecB/TagA/CpsF family glycosyltransferase [Blastocatellia bacterium]|nr:WecB/TagA/CpsF family glycosyltransferase [Blastocatellia bacterium]